MHNIEYREKTYTQERNYTDWFCMQSDLDRVDTLLHILQDSMWDELNGLKQLYHMEHTQNLELHIEALATLSAKIYELARDCEAMESRPEEGVISNV